MKVADDGVVAGAVGDLGERRLLEQQEVGALAHLQRAQPIVETEDPRRVRGGGGERVERREAVDRRRHDDRLGHRTGGGGARVEVSRDREGRARLTQRPDRRTRRTQEERGCRQEPGHGGGCLGQGPHPVVSAVVQMVGAPGAEPHRRLGGSAGPELVGVHAQREAGRRGGSRDGLEVVEREGDVLDVDVHRVRESPRLPPTGSAPRTRPAPSLSVPCFRARRDRRAASPCTSAPRPRRRDAAPAAPGGALPRPRARTPSSARARWCRARASRRRAVCRTPRRHRPTLRAGAGWTGRSRPPSRGARRRTRRAGGPRTRRRAIR